MICPDTFQRSAETLLIVDDDQELSALLLEFLQGEGFECLVEYSGIEGEKRILDGGIDLVILDVMLPGRNGLQVLERIRRVSDIPVLMLTARGEETDRINGLELGADDYLPKPFNPRELLARIRAILRRKGAKSPEPDEKQIIESAGIRLDPFSRSVYRFDRPLKVTSIEFDFLEALMRRAGETVPRDMLSREVLGREFSPLDRSIDVHIGQLRKKLGPLENGEARIKTVRGIGYIFVAGG